jgi:hypothetical protein
MERSAADMEVRSAGGSKLLGWLSGVRGDLRIEQLYVYPKKVVVDADEVRGGDEFKLFSTLQRSQIIHHHDILALGHDGVYEKYQIADYATKMRLIMSDDYVFEWLFVPADDDQHEILFDHPQFIPADTENDDDTEWAISEQEFDVNAATLTGKSINALIADSIFGGSGGAGGLGVSSYTAGASGFASGGTVTAQTMLDAMSKLKGAGYSERFEPVWPKLIPSEPEHKMDALRYAREYMLAPIKSLKVTDGC